MKRKTGMGSGASRVLVRPSRIELDACDLCSVGLGPTPLICPCPCFDICGT